MLIQDLPKCPVCGTIDDCAHCLVEWQTDIGDRQRGQMTPLLHPRLLGRRVAAGRPPRHALLQRLYLDGRARVARGEDPAGVAEDFGYEAQGFAVDCLRGSPFGVEYSTRRLTVNRR